MSPEDLGVIEQLCVALAKTLFYRGRRPEQPGAIRELRSRLLARSSHDEELKQIALALDLLFRVIVLRNERPSSFSVAACGGSEVEYFRVVISEDGEILHDSGKFANPNTAIQRAESWFHLVAWPGSTVTLLAVLSSGQIIKCSERMVKQ